MVFANYLRGLAACTSLAALSNGLLFGVEPEPGELSSDPGDSAVVRLVLQQESIQPPDFAPLTTPDSITLADVQGGDPFALFEAASRPGFQSKEGQSVDTTAAAQTIVALTGEALAPGIRETGPLEIVPPSAFALVNIPDVTESIIETSTSPTLRARRRSPISFEPRIRGYAGGQIYTTFDGAFIGPVRNDLDGVLSKIDRSLLANTEVISGPYGLRYGSGFAFLTFDTIPTPRFEDREHHLRLGSFFRANGGQMYNTATLLGGGERAGYFANVGYRKGSDYESGDGLDIPSSYEALNLFTGVGFDINDETRSETRFTLMDQGETEYALQFFDVDDLNHYGISHSIIHRNEDSGFGYRLDGWFSHTDFYGNTDLYGKRRPDYPVLQRVDQALRIASNLSPTGPEQFRADVGGRIQLAGLRAGVSHQFDEESSVGAGADFRFIQQEIDEYYDLSQFGAGFFNTGLPRAEVYDPGFYVEGASGVTDNWNIAVGARLGFASTRANEGDVLNNANSNFTDINGDVNRDLDVSDILGSFYISNDFVLTDVWRSRIGMGYAERLPDLTERYSDGLFLSVIQGGFNRIIGDPELRKERNWQVDVRFDADYDDCRLRLSAFHAWILDYITYAANVVSDPQGARLLQVLNTEYATLAGCELYGEADLSRSLQAFGSLTYLDGRDREIRQPLSAIYPLESRIGLRWSDYSRLNAWGVESGLRLVDNQDRLGTVRPVGGAGPNASFIRLESETPGFVTAYIRGYYSPSDNVNFTYGVENLFDRDYYEHLNLRLPGQPAPPVAGAQAFGPTIVYSPGITPYVGVEFEY